MAAVVGVGRRAGWSSLSVSSVRLPSRLPARTAPIRCASRLRRFLASTPRAGHESARPLRCGAFANRFRARLDQDWCAAHLQALKSCPNVADQVWGGGRSGRSLREILGGGLVRPCWLIGRSRCSAVPSGARSCLGGPSASLRLGGSLTLGPSWPPRLRFSSVPASRDRTDLAGPDRGSASAGSPGSFPAWAFTSNGWPSGCCSRQPSASRRPGDAVYPRPKQRPASRAISQGD